MNKFSKKNFVKKKSWQNSSLVFLLLIILAIILVRSAFYSFNKYKIAKAKYDKFYTEYSELQKKKERLEKTIEKMETNRGIEEEIRDRYNVVKDGEHLIIINE